MGIKAVAGGRRGHRIRRLTSCIVIVATPSSFLCLLRCAILTTGTLAALGWSDRGPENVTMIAIPNFHDGFFDGLWTSEDKAVRLFLRTWEGERSTIVLTGVERLITSSFWLGNIIFDVTFVEPDRLRIALEEVYQLKPAESELAQRLLGKAQQRNLSALEIKSVVRGRVSCAISSSRHIAKPRSAASRLEAGESTISLCPVECGYAMPSDRWIVRTSVRSLRRKSTAGLSILQYARVCPAVAHSLTKPIRSAFSAVDRFRRSPE